MTPRSYIRYVVLVAAVASTFIADGQVQTPAEVRALPAWAGEDAAARSLPLHYVFRDSNGQIVVSYPHPDNHARRVTYRFWLPNRVDPHLDASVTKKDESGQSMFTYTYKLQNGPSAVSAIRYWSVVVPARQEVIVGHPSWRGSNARDPVAPQALLPDAPVGAFVLWLAVNVPQLSAGAELPNFTLRSRFSPGLTTAYASGEGVLKEPDGEFPQAVVDELIPLQRPQVWRKPVLTIGPRFASGTPLPTILESFRKDVVSLIQQRLLSSESSYVQELQGVLARKESTVTAVLGRKVSPQSPIEKDLDSALRMSAIATQ